jgi:hypothetical protein
MDQARDNGEFVILGGAARHSSDPAAQAGKENDVTARTPSRSALLRAGVALVAAALAMLAYVAFSGSSSPPRPRHLTSQQAAAMLVQCFVGKHLIPASELAAGTTSLPRSDSSTWLHDGKVSGNLRFGDWYSIAGSAITVGGKTIGDWVTAVTASRKAWPADICGALAS